MYTSQSRKNRIELSQYPVEKDLSNRLFLSTLSVSTVEILHEIVNNSLSFPLSELSEVLELSTEKVLQGLKELEAAHLFSINDQTIIVNKEARKYFEVQIERFHEDFRPNTTFFQSLLSLVPIHVLPTWYSIPKTSDDILTSIIDKCYRTTKAFKRYLAELQFENPLTEKVMNAVYQSEELSVDIETLQQELDLNREELEHILISLEFHRICCLSYHDMGNNQWKQVVTPFHEWKEYLLFLKNTEHHFCQNTGPITPIFSSDFGFIEAMDNQLQELSDTPCPLPQIESYSDTQYSLKEAKNRLLARSNTIHLTVYENGTVKLADSATGWLEKPIHEKAMALYFHTIHHYRKKSEEQKFNDRDIREIEHGLKRIMESEWVSVEEFISGLTATFGKHHDLTLTKKGRFWKYALPEYDKSQLTFIREIIYHHLFESGMITLGILNGSTYMKVTEFGKMALGD